MQPVLSDVLARRKNRAIAIILGMKEREVDKFLPQEVSDALRKVVLDQFNDFYEMSVDMMKSLDTGEVTINEHYAERLVASLDQIYDQLTGDRDGDSSQHSAGN